MGTEDFVLKGKELKDLIKSLNPKQKLFAESSAANLNGREAAEAAGYSVKTAKETAHRLLKTPKILKYIEHLKAIAAVNAECTAEDVVKEFAKIAFASPADYFEYITHRDDEGDDNGLSLRMKHFDDMKHPEIIKKIKIKHTHNKDGFVDGAITEVEFHSKEAALNSLGKYFGIFKDKLDLTSGGEPIETVNNVIVINHRPKGAELE